MKKILFLFFVILLSTTLFAQSEWDKYLHRANKALNEGRVDDADKLYNVYKNATKKVDKNFESRLKAKKNTAKKPLQNSSGKSNAKTFTVNGVSFEMVWVEGGTFQMGGNEGDSDEKPVHSVTLDGYYIGKYEVTQALWKAVMGSNPATFIGNKNPVDGVTWYDCQSFIKKLNQQTGKSFSLPTEAQWEYAARGGSKSKNYVYSGNNTLDKVAWHDGNSNGKTHPVGQKLPNELGIYDMSGNVSEWCLDYYADRNFPGVYRGGSFIYADFYCSIVGRIENYCGYCFYDLGLRLVLLP